ncbi:unnamed protein product [Rotaria magnacalcarata]|uniref:Uncharacterized protein n=2 Tax=Rotaria magnacalcarata TaxID=392030 RepID=A0A817AM47_9BILA|nr:unnamed protein product [Rotaria magnacalcarata]
MESLLLQYGQFDLLACNVEEFHVCQNHSDLIIPSRFKNCCLCKPFGRSESSKSGLRIISKLYSFAAWKENSIRLSFGRKMCAQSRNHVDKSYITKEIREGCDELFQWFLVEAYNAAYHWTVRQQILSIMANDLTFSTILMFIPNLTEYRYYRAHRYAKSIGKDVAVDDTRTSTELHLTTDEALLIPLTIRKLAPQRIITQYYDYCKEYYGNTFHHLGQSSLFSMLNECTASTRRSLQGLDSFSAEGSTAFDFLISIVDGLSTLGIVLNAL